VKVALIVFTAATLGLSACGGDDDAEPATPQEALVDAVADQYDSTGLDTDKECLEQTTSALTDEQAERALAQLEQAEIDEDLQGWLDSLGDCIVTS
jgi:hypothetical protein